MDVIANHILILSENQSLTSSLLEDLKALGHNASFGNRAEFEIEKIMRQGTIAIIFDLATWDSNILKSYERLKNNPKLKNQKISVIIATSEDNLSKLPPAVEFDDMILMPYNPRELGLRIKHLLWQNGLASDEEIIKAEDIIIYLARHEVWVKGKRIALAFKEYEILRHLISHRGRVFDRESLLNIIWGNNYYGGARTVDVHIRRIRAKIEDMEETRIKTVRGVGYMFKE